MSIPMNSFCFQCLLNRTLENARALGDEATVTAFARDLMKVYISLPGTVSSSYAGPAVARLMQQYFNQDPDHLREEKELSNRFVMERLDAIRSRVENTSDPVYAALQFSVLGNYLDFAALQGKVSFADLDKMLDTALEMELDADCYHAFRRDLANGTSLLYLTDNAGEIAFDRILAEQIAKEFPNIQVTFCVRGGPVHNDATREDAAAVGIQFPVIDSGSTVGGTVIEQLGEEAKAALDRADVVIAKGMGNIETMYGCGYNVYYAFLVKCQRIVDFFQKPMMTPMLVREPQAEGLHE